MWRARSRRILSFGVWAREPVVRCRRRWESNSSPETLVLRATVLVLPEQTIAELLKLHDEVHVRPDPLAAFLRLVVCFLHAAFRLLVQPVGDDQTSRSTDTTLAVDENTLSLLDPIIHDLDQLVQIRNDIGVMLPGHVDVLWCSVGLAVDYYLAGLDCLQNWWCGLGCSR